MEVRSLIAGTAVMAALACGRPSEGPVRTTTDQGTSQAPGAATLEQSDQALVRIVHAMPDVPKADVYTGEQKTWSGVDFGTVTAYRPVSEPRFKLALKPAGQDAAPAMLEAQEGVDAGRRYTILALPDAGGAAKVDVVTDDVEPPSPGKAKLRIIHAAPEAGKVDVVATASGKKEPIIDDVAYGSPATYHEVDPASVTLQVQPKGREGKGVALVREQDQLEAGKVYTLVVAAGDKPGEPVGIIKIEDQVEPAQAAAATDAETGKVPAMQREPEYEIQPDVEGLKKEDEKK
jgi:hypothetical protein